MKSLAAQGQALAGGRAQIQHLESVPINGFKYLNFDDKLRQINAFPLKPVGVDIFQVNLGKMCNQVCKHCHVDAGPDRKEIMSLKVMQFCLDAVKKSKVKTVDITGGAPEMNPHFRWFVKELHSMGTDIMVRCNLTI